MGLPSTLRRSVALVVLALSGMVAAFATIAPSPAPEAPLRGASITEPVAIELDRALLPSPASYVRHERFERGDTVAGFLRRLGLRDAQIERWKRLRSLQLLRPGMWVDAEVTAAGDPLYLSFMNGRESRIEIVPEGDGFRAEEQRAEFTRVAAIKASEIRSSLFAAADAAGIPDSVAIQLADIFGGDVDFHRDLRKGDRFTVMYEVLYLDGRPVRAGRVLAAEFVNQGRSYRAVYFEGASGKGGYYTPDGKNLRKAFLRSPLEFSRVSSGFGMRRHPFMKTWRAHKGIDYAAPTGTSVRAAGDGVVDFAGRKGGYGNVVILRHHGQYSTVYAHLSRFASGVRRGSRVAQGETIGYVGQTGWATGPHLHYEFRIAGEARNPFAIAMPAAQPVAPQELPAFREVAAPLVAKLDLLANANLALLE